MAMAESAPDLEWLLAPIVPATGAVFIVAPPNVGKTWLALALAKYADEKARTVTIVEEEGGLKALASRFKSLAFPPTAGIFIAHQKGVKLTPPTVAELAKWIAGEPAPVVILDPLSALFDGDENETREAAALVEQLRTLQRSNPNLLLVVLHHASKAGARGEGPSLYAARGSSVFSGWCDTQLNLEACEEPTGSGRIAFFIDTTKQRDAEKAPRQQMTITMGDGTVTLDSATQVASDNRERIVLGTLVDRPAGMSGNELFAKAKGNRAKFFALLEDMEGRGLLDLEARGTARIFRLAAPKAVAP